MVSFFSPINCWYKSEKETEDCYWTLEMFCINPIRIYAGVAICQIYYHSIQGDYLPYSSSKYQNNTRIQPSMLYKDFE